MFWRKKESRSAVSELMRDVDCMANLKALLAPVDDMSSECQVDCLIVGAIFELEKRIKELEEG